MNDDNKKIADDQVIEPVESEDINDKTEHLKHEIEEWKGKYLRALADYQNMERRRSVERVEEIKYAAKEFIIKILPVLDVLYQAQGHLKDKGLELAIKQFHDVLKTEQVEKIDTVGMSFDPHQMECIEVVEGAKDDIVVEEVQPGYLMHDKVIRVARVKVSEKKKVNN